MQRQHADLATPGALKWWRDRAASGQLVSVGGGPPCETYTAARYHVLEGTKGPRPLRSAEWGANWTARTDESWTASNLDRRQPLEIPDWSPFHHGCIGFQWVLGAPPISGVEPAVFASQHLGHASRQTPQGVAVLCSGQFWPVYLWSLGQEAHDAIAVEVAPSPIRTVAQRAARPLPPPPRYARSFDWKTAGWSVSNSEQPDYHSRWAEGAARS